MRGASLLVCIAVSASSCGGCGQVEPTPPSLDTLSTATWATFTKVPEAHYTGQEFPGATARIASDPCVAKEGDRFRMVYTCFTSADSGGLCSATSEDGRTWTRVPSIVDGVEGVIADSRRGQWDENIETCALLRGADGSFELFYAGYPNLNLLGTRTPAALGRMTSTDGVTFTRTPDDGPILAPIPGDYDGDDLFSAVAVIDGDVTRFVYAAWCVPGYNDGRDCIHAPAIQIGGATRDANGTFTREEAPVLQPRADVASMQWGVAEPELVQGPNGAWYLFFTGGLGDDEQRVVGVARSDSPFGPWEIAPEPILAPGEEPYEACGNLAPSVIIDGYIVRIWYITLDDCGGACPSCNLAACDCQQQSFTTGYAEAPWPLVQP